MGDAQGAPKIPNLWEGRLVRLRAIEPGDWEASLVHDRDSEVQRTGWNIEVPRSVDATRRWAEQAANAEPDGDNRRLAIETVAGEFVGGLSVNNSDRRNGTFRYGIALFRPYFRRGYGSEALRLLLRFSFGELRYQKVLAGVYDFNEASIALHRALGFVEEGRVRRAYFSAGRHHDEVLFGMTAEAFTSLHPEFAPRLPGLA